MTTPAKNVNQESIGSLKVRTFRVKPLPRVPLGVDTYTGNLVNRVVDVRPASGNAGRVKSFKLCRNWDHRICNLTASDSDQKEIIVTNGPNDVWQQLVDGRGFWNNGVGNIPPVPSLPTGNMTNAALVKALNKLKEQDFHLGNFVGEFHQVVRMVGGRATSIARQIEKFRGKYPKDFEKARSAQVGHLPRHLWCTIPNSWLELQYGWKPLMSDVLGALQHLFKTARREIPVIVVHAKHEDLSSLSNTALFSLYPFEAKVNWTHYRKAGVSLAYRVTNSTVHELSSLGLINPLEIVWELTRFSFVVDWFFPIGPWMSAMTGDAGLTFITGALSQLGKIEFDGSSVTKRKVSSVELVGGGPPVWNGKDVIFRRTCYTSSPWPGVYVKNPLSALHVANAIALLAQAFRPSQL